MVKLCLTCLKKDASEGFKPFCSKRCADIDLGRWLNGDYVIEGEDGAAFEVANDRNIPPKAE